MVRQIFALGVVFLCAAACGGQSTSIDGDDEPAAGEAGETGKGGGSNGGSASGGKPSGGSPSGGVSSGATSSGGFTYDGYEPCVGKQCGEPCSYGCPPMSACDPVPTYCDATGFCSAAVPINCSPECRSAKDCPEVDVACLPCPDGSIVCPEVECVRGACMLGSAACPECREDADCPAPPFGCSTCDDGSTTCPSSVCWNGECHVGWLGGCVGSHPCADLECGAPCKPCTLPDCPPLAVPHFCDSKMECAPEPLGCFGKCKVATDCPPPPPSCGDCPIDTCLTVACVNEACEFVCR